MKKVAVVVPVRNEEALPKFVAEVFDSIPTGYEANLVLVVNNSTSEFEQLAETIAEGDLRIRVLQLGRLGPRTFAYAYLRGLEYAVRNLEADFVVEMDAGGSHNPRDLLRFVRGLESAETVFSTRFSRGGKMIHPLQRKLASLTGTLLANLLLGLGRFVPDMTGGYEAFRREVLRDLFELVPPNDWLTVNREPAHLYQMEMRAYLCWMRRRLSLVPIVMGVGKVRKPQKLGFGKLCLAFGTLIALRKWRREFLARLSQT